MESILLHASPADHHQSVSPPHNKTHPINYNTSVPRRGSIMNRPSSISRQTSDNFAPILNPPPPFHGRPISYNSYPPFPFYRQQQPPLLPLPISATPKPNNTTNTTTNTKCPPANRKPRTTRESSLTPKKSKTLPKKEEKVKSLGPEPAKDLPTTTVPKILTLSSGSKEFSISSFDAIVKDVEVGEFSGSVSLSAISPPPSSLPLPTFSLKPKQLMIISCNAQAAGGLIDAGRATDDLRRLLRLPGQ